VNTGFNSHVHSSPPFLPIFSQTNLIHSFPSYLLKIHFNIILPYNSRSTQWPLTFRFSYSKPVCALLLCHTCHMPCQSHHPWCYHPNDIWWEVILNLAVISTQITRIFYVYVVILKCKISYFSVSIIQYYSALIITAQLTVGHQFDLCFKH
jgi:hypothetical protein